MAENNNPPSHAPFGSGTGPGPDRNEMPVIPDHEVLQFIGSGASGEVWLAKSAMGTLRAAKVVRRKRFQHDRPYEREFDGLKHFEPISRKHDGLVNILQVGRHDGYFYYVMEAADSVSKDATS